MMDYQHLWKFIGEAYHADGYIDGQKIDRYQRESEDKFNERKKIAYYANIFETKVERYIGYLFKKTPVRQLGSHPIYPAFIEDCDGAGTHIDVFMKNFAKNAKARGVGIVLIDNASEIPTTLNDQLAQRAFPFITEILPENLSEYKLDKYGRFEYIAFPDVIDNSSYGNKDVKNVVRYFDQTSWAIYDGEEVLSSGDHNLGICPAIFFSEKGNFYSLGEFSKLAWLSKRHYNLHSEQDEQLRSNTFNILAIHGTGNDNMSLAAGNALFYSGDKMPSFIAPSPDPHNSYEKKIKNLEEIMDNIAYDVTTGREKESGISLQIKFQGLNGSLASYARGMEDLEARVFGVVSRYLGIKNDVSISYQKEFNIIDVQHEAETLSLIDSIANIPTYRAKKLAQIIKSDLNNITEEEFSQIIAEIEDNQKEV